MRRIERDNSTRKLISLFAGAGGLDIGLELAGFEARVINEFAPYACETLRVNQKIGALSDEEFDHWFRAQSKQKCYKGSSEDDLASLKNRIRPPSNRRPYMKDAVIVEDDIRRLSSEMLLSLAESAAGEIFLVAGGPPCQPFSRAGKRQSVEAEDGRLFLEFVRVVEDVRPRWFLFENVKGLILTKTDVVSGSCKHCYLNWTVSFEERLSHLGGLPLSSSCPKCQSVEVEMTTNRVAGGTLDIILGEFEALGYECHSTILNAADFGTPQLRERLIIVGSRDHERFQWPYPTHQNARARKAPTLFESAITPEWRGIGDALWSNGHPAYGQLDRDKAVLWVKNVVRPHDEPVTWPLNRPSPTIGAHQAAKLALAPFGVPAEQLARQQWHTLGRRQRDLPKVFVEHRYLSDDELLKLQTFPESWYLFGTRMQRAAQIGNAVPVVLAAALGGAILAACSTDSFQRDHSVPPIGKTDEHLASVHG